MNEQEETPEATKTPIYNRNNPIVIERSESRLVVNPNIEKVYH